MKTSDIAKYFALNELTESNIRAQYPMFSTNSEIVAFLKGQRAAREMCKNEILYKDDIIDNCLLAAEILTIKINFMEKA